MKLTKMTPAFGKRSVLAKTMTVTLSVSLSLSLMLASTLPVFAIDPTALEHYKKAVSFEREGKLNEAASELQTAISYDPYDPLNFIKLGGILAELGRVNEAISKYKTAASLDAQDPMVYFSLGALYEQTGNYAEAEASYNRGVAKDPDYVYGLMSLARSEAQQGKYALAIEHYDKFLQRYPAHYDARRLLANLLLVNGKEAEAAKQYAYMKQENPDEFSDHVLMARAQTRSNEPEKALDTLKEAYQKEGNQSDIAEEMANAHLALGQSTYAIQNLEKARALNPVKTQLSLRLADLYQSANRPKDAVDAYQSYLKEKPDDLAARHGLGVAYLAMKDYPHAIEQMTTVLKEMPETTENEKLRYDLTKQVAYAYQMKGDTAQAIAGYEYLSHQPSAKDDPQLRQNLAIAYHQSGQLENAVAIYEELYREKVEKSHQDQLSKGNASGAGYGNVSADDPALKMLGNDLAAALSALGDREYKAGNLSDARKHYETAMAYRDQANVAPLLGLANTYYLEQAKNPAENPTYAAKAVELYQQVLAKDPNNTSARLYLAKLDQQAGRLEQAMRAYEIILAKEPGNAEVALALSQIYSGSEEHQKNAAMLQRAVAANPNEDVLYIELGNAYQRLNQLAEAQQAYEQAKILNANNARARYNLGVLYGEQGKLSDSASEYRMAIMLEPDFSDALYGLGVTLERQQKYAEAIDSYRDYVTLGKGDYVQQAQQRITLLEKSLPKNLLKPTTKPNQSPAKSPEKTSSTSTLPFANTANRIKISPTTWKAEDFSPEVVFAQEDDTSAFELALGLEQQQNEATEAAGQADHSTDPDSNHERNQNSATTSSQSVDADAAAGHHDKVNDKMSEQSSTVAAADEKDTTKTSANPANGLNTMDDGETGWFPMMPSQVDEMVPASRMF